LIDILKSLQIGQFSREYCPQNLNSPFVLWYKCTVLRRARVVSDSRVVYTGEKMRVFRVIV